MPSSSARWIVAIDSASSVAPYQADIPMQPSPCSETSSPCPSVRVSIAHATPQPGLPRRFAIVAAAHGRPEAENLEVAPRQAPRDARDQRAEGERLPERAGSRSARTASARPAARTRAARSSRSASTLRKADAMIRIAVDAMGGDRGPGRDRRGRARGARATAIEPILFGDAGSTPRGLELRPTTEVIGMDEKPAEAVRAKPDSSLVAAVPRRRRGRRPTRSSPPATPARCSPRASLELRRLPGVHAARDRRADPGAARPVASSSTPARTPTPRRAPAPVRDDGRRLRRGDPRRRRARACGSSRSARSAEKGNQLTLEAHELLAASDLNFQGNAEGRDVLARRRRRRRHRRLHRQRRAEDARGHDPHHPRRAARAEITATHDRQARRPARSARPPGGSASRLDPGHLRRRLPPRPARARRDRARQLLAAPRSRTRSASRPAASSTTSSAAWCTRCPSRTERCMIGALFQAPTTNEVTWQRRARKSSSGSRKS